MRSELIDLVQLSMHGMELSPQQQHSLKLLANENTSAVVTGQQIGLLGGPLYTLLKIASAWRRSQQRSESSPTIPVFWLEDNDHDAQEASSTTLLDAAGLLVSINTWDGTSAKLPVAQRTFDAATIERVREAIMLLSGQYADEVQSTLLTLYREGSHWTDAFLQLLQPYLAAWGVLVVRASLVVEKGLHAPILRRDMDPPGALTAVINATTNTIVQGGKRAQATVGSSVFFGSNTEGRTRIDPSEAIAKEATSQPERFSPTVLSRPLVQDAVLPTVEAVLGAAEIAYHEQLNDAYTFCGIEMPARVLRHGLTIVDNKTERTLTKDSHSADWYFVTREELEAKLTHELSSNVVPDADAAKDLLHAAIAPFEEAATVIDRTLVATVNAQRATMSSGIDALAAKLRSAAKKQQAAAVERARSAHTLLYPNGIRQERVYPIAFWQARLGPEVLRAIVEESTTHPIGTHSVICASSLQHHNTP